MDKIHKAGAIIIQDKKMMLVKPYKKDTYLTPGGKYEKGENAEQCLRRELMEELRVEVKSFKHYKDYYFDTGLYADRHLLLELYLVEVEGQATPSNEIEVINWIDKENFHTFGLMPSFSRVLPDLINDGLL